MHCSQVSPTVSDPLAEAACFAILCRVAPMLRHEIAGLMQPVRLTLTVLERRMLAAELDRTMISENVTLANSLSKEAGAGCMNAIGWITEPGRGTASLRVDLHTAIDQTSKLLALELAGSSLKLINGVTSASTVTQGFVRTVLTGVLLAFCDAQVGASELRITLSGEKLLITVVKNEGSEGGAAEQTVQPQRPIDWRDIEALMDTFDFTMHRSQHEVWIDVKEIKG